MVTPCGAALSFLQVWTNYYDALPECRWNFAMQSFMAMPKWRLFIFGGKSRREPDPFAAGGSLENGWW